MSLPVNPIIRLEFTRRFRSPLAYIGIALALTLPTIIVLVIYNHAEFMTKTPPRFLGHSDGVGLAPGFDFDGTGRLVPQDQPYGVPIDQLNMLGREMLAAVGVTLLTALFLIVPAIAGSAISGERQNTTLQPLQITALAPRDIVVGKLVSSTSYLFVILLCATPALSVPFLLGGIEWSMVAKAVVAMLMIGLEIAAVSLAISARMKRAATGIVVSMIAVFALTLGPVIVTGFVLIRDNQQMNQSADAMRTDVENPSKPLRDAAMFATPSPLAVGTILSDKSQSVFDKVEHRHRTAALLFWFGVTTISLISAVNGVTAPVERDR